MATKKALRGSFRSLGDTLDRGYSPFFSQQVVARWTGVGSIMRQIADRVSAWLAAPDQSDGYAGVIRALDAASGALAAADDDGERLAALDTAENALNALNQTL